MKPPGRVTHIITRMNIGGPGRYFNAVAPLLEERGWSVALVHGRESSSEGHLEPAVGDVTAVVQLARRPAPAEDLMAYRVVRRHLVRSRPDIVHTHTAKAGLLGRLAARSVRIPSVHTYHGHIFDGYFSAAATRILVQTERALARRTRALVAVSPQVRNDLFDLGIGHASQWHVVPLDLELDAFVKSDLAPAAARATLGLPPDVPVVGFVGRLAAIKNVPLFLSAAREVARHRPDAVFVVAGDGDLRAELEREVRGAPDLDVRFLGWVTDLPTLYRALDVTVLTSRNEGTPVSLIESGAAGTPVVATSVGGVPDVVSDRRTGLLVQEDPRLVARGIEAIIGDAALGLRLGAAARESMWRRFGSGAGVAMIDDIYRNIHASPSGKDESS